MAKGSDPSTFSSRFGVERKHLRRLGVLDPTLAIDTSLFIDPLLLRRSRHPEISGRAAALYREHFETVIKLLRNSSQENDPGWRAAFRRLTFHEIKGTCLGYGAASIAGSGFGAGLTNRVIKVAKQVVDMGVTDPDLFTALAIFEERIGPDRISDMTTNVVRSALLDFNVRVVRELGLTGRAENFDLNGVRGRLLRNPLQRGRTPVILVPRDILRQLPIAADWDAVSLVCSHNERLRERVNEHIGAIWAAKTKRDKNALRDQALASRAAFQSLLDAVHAVKGRPYNDDKDPEGLIRWAHVAEEYARRFPLAVTPPTSGPRDANEAEALVSQIVSQFAHLVEKRGLNRELYRSTGRPRHESTAQRLFFAVAYSYCKAHNMDVSPEIDTGTGKIDFKFSKGFDSKVLVELKLSTNPKLAAGYRNQLGTYREAEETTRALYLVIDVGGPETALERLTRLGRAATRRKERASKLVVIDGTRKPTASKR